MRRRYREIKGKKGKGRQTEKQREKKRLKKR